MSIATILAIIFLIVILVVLFYVPPDPFGLLAKIVATVCAILLFLMSVGVLHL